MRKENKKPWNHIISIIKTKPYHNIDYKNKTISVTEYDLQRHCLAPQKLHAELTLSIYLYGNAPYLRPVLIPLPLQQEPELLLSRIQVTLEHRQPVMI
jgi:hypothetical protein